MQVLLELSSPSLAQGDPRLTHLQILKRTRIQHWVLLP